MHEETVASIAGPMNLNIRIPMLHELKIKMVCYGQCRPVNVSLYEIILKNLTIPKISGCGY